MPTVVADLPVRESQRGKAGHRVGLIAKAVLSLLGGGSVVAEAVGLDDQAEGGPIEVDAETIDSLLCEGWAKTCPADDSQKTPLELRVGEHELATIEDFTQRTHPPLPFALVQSCG